MGEAAGKPPVWRGEKGGRQRLWSAPRSLALSKYPGASFRKGKLESGETRFDNRA